MGGPAEPGAADGRRRDALALLGLFALIAAPFAARALTGATGLSNPLRHDIGFQWIPFREFIRNSLAAGVLPLWSPEIFAGFPFAAFPHTSVFYPPGLLFLAGSYAKVVNLYYPLHLFAASAGVFLLCRSLRLMRPAAFAAAASYAFTGKPFHFIHFLPATQSNTWMPWLILGALLAARGRARGVALAVAAFALAILGGEVESAAYGLVFAAAALLILARDEALPRRRLLLAAAPLALGGLLASVQLVPLLELSHWFARNQGVTFAYFTRRELPPTFIYALFAPFKTASGSGLDVTYFYLGAATFGLALAAAAVRARPGSRKLALLTAFVFAFSYGSISFLDRLQYAVPGFNRFGTPEQGLFIGQLFLALLAGQGLDAVGRDRRAAAIAGMTLAAFVAVEALIGWRDGLVAGAWVECGITAVAGVALIVIFRDGLVARVGSPAEETGHGPAMTGKAGDKSVAPTKWAAVAVAAVLVFNVWLLAALQLPNNRPTAFEPPAWFTRLAAKFKPAQGRVAMVSRLGPTDPDLLHHVGMRLDFDLIDGWITTPIRSYIELLALADPRVARFKNGQLDYLGVNGDPRDGRFIDAPGMPILDLIGLRFVIDRGVPIKFSSPSFLNFVPPEYRWRTYAGQSAREPGRDKESTQLIFDANETMRLRLHIDRGDQLSINPVVMGDEGDTVDLVIEAKPVDGATITIFSWRAGSLDGNPIMPRPIPLDLLIDREIDLIISTRAKPGSDAAIFWGAAAIVNADRPFQLVAGDPLRPMVYENHDVLPRGFVVRDFVVAAPDDDLKLIKTMPAAELRRKLILAWAPADLAPVAGAKAGKAATLTRRRPGEEVWQVSVPQPGLLFVSDQYYPGWHALVEGREEPILRADHAFRAVRVGPGDGEVRFVFRPWSLRLGIWSSVAGLIAFAVFVYVRPRARTV